MRAQSRSFEQIWQLECGDLPSGGEIVIGLDQAMRQSIVAQYRSRATKCVSIPSALQPIPGLEDPGDHRQADHEEPKRHRQAHADAHVGGAVEAPAKAADQVDDRIEQG